jgi:hypothetical protein
MTPKTRKTRVVAHVDDLLRGKLTDIRDTAIELSAILEFGKPEGVAADPLWRFAQTVIEEAEAPSVGFFALLAFAMHCASTQGSFSTGIARYIRRLTSIARASPNGT